MGSHSRGWRTTEYSVPRLESSSLGNLLHEELRNEHVCFHIQSPGKLSLRGQSGRSMYSLFRMEKRDAVYCVNKITTHSYPVNSHVVQYNNRIRRLWNELENRKSDHVGVIEGIEERLNDKYENISKCGQRPSIKACRVVSTSLDLWLLP